MPSQYIAQSNARQVQICSSRMQEAGLCVRRTTLWLLLAQRCLCAPLLSVIYVCVCVYIQTGEPNYEEAKKFAEAVHAKFPGVCSHCMAARHAYCTAAAVHALLTCGLNRRVLCAPLALPDACICLLTYIVYSQAS